MDAKPLHVTVTDLLRPRRRHGRAAVLAYRVSLPLLGLLLTVGSALAVRKPSTPIALFVENSDGRRGVATVVIETRTPLSVASGTITLQLTPEGGRQAAPAVARIDGVDVMSKRGDSVGGVTLTRDGNQQTIRVDFKSTSGTINRTAGPLAVLHLRLNNSVRRGAKYRMQWITTQTRLQDPRGRAVDLKLHDGELNVRGSRVPHRFAVGDDVAAPGTIASFDLQTMESINLSEGQLAFRYDPAITSGLPTVRLAKNHGSGQAGVTYPEPGLMVVQFSSPAADWSSVPGSLLAILMPLAKGVAPGASSTLRVDSSMTDLTDSDGNEVAARFSSGQLKVGDDTDTDNDGVEDADDPDDDNDGVLDDDDPDDNNDGVDDDSDNDTDNDGIDDENDPDDDNDGINDDEDTDDDGDGIPDDEDTDSDDGDDGDDGGDGGDND